MQQFAAIQSSSSSGTVRRIAAWSFVTREYTGKRVDYRVKSLLTGSKPWRSVRNNRRNSVEQEANAGKGSMQELRLRSRWRQEQGDREGDS